jgi:predicted component of type VI protein secretion system
MAKLILSMDGLVLGEFHLDKPRIAIGRRASNDIQIDNLAVSGEHAAIVTILNDSFLEDLQSTNGTQVNGRAIKKCVLHDNDEIGIGKYKVRYLAEVMAGKSEEEEGVIKMVTASNIGTATNFSGIPADGENFPAMEETQMLPQFHEMTHDMPHETAPRHDTPSAPELVDISFAGMHPVLQILSGSNKGKELPLTKEQTLLGRMGGTVASIRRELQCYYFSYVEGEPLPMVNHRSLGETPHRLCQGDEIEVAGVRMIFLWKV